MRLIASIIVLALFAGSSGEAKPGKSKVGKEKTGEEKTGKKKIGREKEQPVISSTEKPAVLWTQPSSIASRDLFYGIGGEEREPVPPFHFVKEDLNGNSPKFDVEDANGVKWRVKLGAEAKPKTATTRLIWAVGYITDEDYFFASQP